MSLSSPPPSPLIEDHFRYHAKAQERAASPNKANVKKLYMRELSNVVRKWSSKSGVDGMNENTVLPLEGQLRVIVVTICRIRQRILTQAWDTWIKKANIVHDYESDLRQILCRKIPEDELRSELEIEVMYRWVKQAKDVDPTGVANTIFLSKKKAAKYAALQQLRLEFYDPGDTVIFQCDIPRQEDGHFTVLRGECDVLQFPDESVPLMKLQYLAKKKRFDDARRLLSSAQLVARIPKYSGFGELSTLTGVRRAASIRTSPKCNLPIEIVVLPKQSLMDCLKSRSQDDASTSEAIDFLRQSGLANRISPKDLVQAARSMVRRTLLQGDILYYKGEPSRSMFLVVSGEFLLDVGEFMVEGQPLAFVANAPDKCYYLSAGSILGDEGVLGEDKVFASTAVVVSTAAVVFEAVDFGLAFLAEKLRSLRYCALYYKDKLRWDNPNPLAEQVNPYTYFNSLRKTIAFTSPFRGVMSIAEEAAKHLSRRAPSPKGSKKLKRNEEEEQRMVKSRNKYVRHLDSRASFLMLGSVQLPSLFDAALLGEESKVFNPFTEYPRVLSPMGLHRAIEINKVAKKAMQQSMKSHAKESILYEQLRKIPDDDNDEEKMESAKLFRKGLRDYYKREEEAARKRKEEEEERKLINSRASTAIKFFASTLDDGDDDDGDGALGAKAQGRVQINNISTDSPNAPAAQPVPNAADNASVASIESDSVGPIMSSLMGIHTTSMSSEHDIYASIAEGQAPLPKLLQYYDWIDSLNRAHYRQLLASSRVTADILHYQLSHEGALPPPELGGVGGLVGGGAGIGIGNTNTSTGGDGGVIEELGEMFRNFGLTPQDLNIPWQFDKQSPSLQKGESMKTLAFLPPVTPEANKRNRRGGVVAVPGAGGGAAGGGDGGGKGRGVTLKNSKGEVEDRVAMARLESQYGSAYLPSSWRDEMIRKKAAELAGNAYRFFRQGVPDNRRVLSVRVGHMHGHGHGHGYGHSYGHGEGKYAIEPYIPENKENRKKEQYLHATIKLKKDSDEAIEMNFGDLIDNPMYYMDMLGGVDLGSPNRPTLMTNNWYTRYMKMQADIREPKVKLTSDTVRTHLKENLTSYSKENLLKGVKKIQEATYNRPIIQTWGDDEALMHHQAQHHASDGFGPPISQSLSYSGSPTHHAPAPFQPQASHHSTLAPSHPSSVAASSPPERRMSTMSVFSALSTSSDMLSPPHPQPIHPPVLLPSSLEGAEGVDGMSVAGASVGGGRSVVAGSVAADGRSVVEGGIGGGASVVIPTSDSKVEPVETGQKMGMPIPAPIITGVPPSSSTPSSPSSPKRRRPKPDSPPEGELGVGSLSGGGSLTDVLGVGIADPKSGGRTGRARARPAARGEAVSTVRITDTKAASKALQAFDEYLVSQQKESQAAMEGRKKANRSSKFKLPASITNTHTESHVSLNEINQARWKAEWTLFHTMFPQANAKNTQAFIEAFKAKFPESMIRGDIKYVPHESVSLNYPSAMTHLVWDELSGSDKSAPSLSPLKTPSAHHPRDAMFSPAASTDEATHASKHKDDDPALLNWQEFTVQSIREGKEGERKTLPHIAPPPLNIQGKKYRGSSSMTQTFTPLVTLPPRKEEEPIIGPPEYLSLYKKGAGIHLTEREKKKTIEGLQAFKRKMLQS